MIDQAIMFVIGLIAGAVTLWLILRARIQNAFNEGKASFEPERVSLEERLAARQGDVERLDGELAKSRDDYTSLELALREITGKKAAAEQVALRVPELQSTLTH